MGQCAAKSAVDPAQIDVEVPSEKAKVIAKESSIKKVNGVVNVTPPVRVFRDGKEERIQITSTKSGRVLFGVSENDPYQPDGPAQLSVDGSGEEALRRIQEMELLQSMGLEVRYSGSFPFIGKLSLKILEVSGSKHGTSTYVKVDCEDDKGNKKYANAAASEESTVCTFTNVEYIFIIVHSNATFRLKVRDEKQASFFGEITVAIQSIAQGVTVHDFEMRNPKDEKVVGTLKVEVGYEWLRGTKDEGSYNGAARVVVNKRKMRRYLGAGPLEAVSQVNHWVMSHDNVCNVKPKGNEGLAAESSGKSPEDLELEVEEEGANEAAESDPRARMLRTKTSGSERMTSAARWQQSLASAKDRHASSATAIMNASNLTEALSPKEGESADVAALKEQMMALMLSMFERFDTIEAVQEKHGEVIQELGHLVKGAEAGQGEAGKPAGLAVNLDVEPFISGTFEYGMGRPAANRKVFLFLNKAADQKNLQNASVQFIGVYRTNKQGRLVGVPVPGNVWTTPGHYNVVGLLPEDNTFAKGSLFILERGSKCVVFDMDGTLTVGDSQVVTTFALDMLAGSTAAAANLSHKYDIKARKMSLHLVRSWAAKGYQPVYLSGRQGSYYNLTLEWLIKHNYPPGPIHLTRTHVPTLPIYYSVGNFKVAYMEGLQARGIEIFAAYGNTPTDSRAYKAVGIPDARIFIVGPAGGKNNTVRVDNWTDHLPVVFGFPDAPLPTPYTELLFTANPGYKRKIKETDAKTGLSREYSSIESTPSAVRPSLQAPVEAEDEDDLEDEQIAAKEKSLKVFVDMEEDSSIVEGPNEGEHD